MSNRRSFLKSSVAGLLLTQVSPAMAMFSEQNHNSLPTNGQKQKLRFAIASDGHYGQPGTPYRQDHQQMIEWLQEAHQKTPLDFVIINGDLVHDQPNLLAEVKREYYDKLPVPFYAVPGNHDHADTALWKSVFGHEDNFSFEKNGIGFVLANTSDTKGTYLCPDNKFIEKELEKFKTLETVFVVLHIPPYIWVPKNPFVDCKETIDLLHRYANVKAVFHGHDHSLDGVFYTGNLPHFFDAHIGGSWGTSYKGYRIVEVADDFKIKTYLVNASRNPILNETKL